MDEMGDAADAAELLAANPRQIHKLWPTDSAADLTEQPYRHQAGYRGVPSAAKSVSAQVG